jgi:hypothetical protein
MSYFLDNGTKYSSLNLGRGYSRLKEDQQHIYHKPQGTPHSDNKRKLHRKI